MVAGRRSDYTAFSIDQALEIEVRRMKPALERARSFANRFGLRLPILLAPMAGVPAPKLSIAVANAGGLGSLGVVQMEPPAIRAWADDVRAKSNGAFQLNIWIPDPPPRRDAAREAQMRSLLAKWGPEVPAEAGDTRPPDFDSQLEAMLEVGPPVISSVMGLFPSSFVARLKAHGILWFASISTLAEARAAEQAGADAIVAQGAEAGGHRGAFDGALGEARMVGLFSLLPSVADAVKLPVVAAGGIADARGVAAALTLGASAVAIGTGFLRTPEAELPSAWADALVKAAPEDTSVTRAFSGRPGRALANAYVRAIATDAPAPAPYPVQRGLTARMRSDAVKTNDIERMQAWAGQSAALAKAIPAADLMGEIWDGARELLA
jgi:nitronate monooxygenase